MNTLTDPTRNDIKAAITFYEKYGWDWLSLVAFLSCRAMDMPIVVRTLIGADSKRRPKRKAKR